ncbi:MAG: NUDIX domain-containing protein [Chloroflexi bacterium]|nr:NUDIX domain-containing protein [Chloroflexota bacterium]
MATLVFGERIGKSARIRTGCSAAILDAERHKVLLQRRADNGRWGLPGGGMDSGESAAETCAREVLEETGLQVKVTRLIGIYTNPHFIIEYADGNRWQIVAFHFEAEVIGGEPTLNEETEALAYFSPSEIEQLDLMEHHRERIKDTFTQQQQTFIR